MKVKPEWVSRFQSEAIAHLEMMTAAIPTLMQTGSSLEPLAKEQDGDYQILRQCFIKAHSIKGTAAMLKLIDIATLAAELEIMWSGLLQDATRREAALYQQAAVKIADLLGLLVAIEPDEDTTLPIK